MGFSNVGYPQIPFSDTIFKMMGMVCPTALLIPPTVARHVMQPSHGQEADNQKIPELLKPLKSKDGRLSRTYSRSSSPLKLWIEDD
jgi:short subunit fatty acids transporter